MYAVRQIVGEAKERQGDGVTLGEIVSRMDQLESEFVYDIEKLAARFKHVDDDVKELTERYQDRMAKLKEELRNACGSAKS